MHLSRRSFSFAVFPLLIVTLVTGVFAQADTDRLEPSYEVALHVVIGSNEPGRGDIPPALSNISKQLRSNFAFSNYRLANTFLGRISNTGTVEYKSVSNIFGQESDADLRTFLEWSMTNFRSVPNGFQAKAFRFGAKVPIKTGVTKDPGTQVINYEPVGLTMYLVGLPANTPTLIGTISLPNANGTMFLVATVKNPEM